MTNPLLCSERKTIGVLMLALLPWVCVAVFAAGFRTALSLFAYAILAFLAGYAVVSAALPAGARAHAMVLAPSAGVLALSALTAFWLRLGLPLPWVYLVWCVLLAAGIICLWLDRGQVEKTTMEYGIAMVLLSTLICALYFIPSAFNDATPRHDGSFTWLTIDTQLNHSIVTSIKNGGSPPHMAGTSTAELFYHFGPYAMAAAISRFTGIETGDALARAIHGVEEWALVFSSLGLGTILSLKATGKTFGGIMSVAGLFFYGSILSLFSGAMGAHIVAPWSIFFEAGGQFPTNGGPFSHILLGLSMLHGLVAVTAIIGLCLAQRSVEPLNFWQSMALLILPALAITVHSVAGLYCLGVVAILLFWGHLGVARSWILIAVMLGLFLGAWKVMGFEHAPAAVGAGIRLSQLPTNWWTFVMWFSVALGIRIISFGWVTKTLKSPMAMLVLVSFVGLLAFSWVEAIYMGLEHYGAYYLQAVFSIFGFSRLPWGFWRSEARGEWVGEWLSLSKKGLLLFTVCGILIGLFGYAIHGTPDIRYFRYRVLSCMAFLLLLSILPAKMKQSRRSSAVVSSIVAVLLLFGFLAWVPPWFKYHVGGQTYNVTLTSGEVYGLHRLSELSIQGDRFATNKHLATDGSAQDSPNSSNSYGYGALAGVPVLLEGYYDGSEQNIPGFGILLRDNNTLFTTTDPDALRGVTRAYRVRWVVARPGTDISLPKPLPAWLIEQQDCGDLKIYRID